MFPQPNWQRQQAQTLYSFGPNPNGNTKGEIPTYSRIPQLVEGIGLGPIQSRSESECANHQEVPTPSSKKSWYIIPIERCNGARHMVSSTKWLGQQTFNLLMVSSSLPDISSKVLKVQRQQVCIYPPSHRMKKLFGGNGEKRRQLRLLIVNRR